jgi:hypothetical protein
MPRFGIKTLLIAVAAIALWLSTLTGFTSGQDVQRSILLVILFSSALGMIYCVGRERAFSASFFACMLVVGLPLPTSIMWPYRPEFRWLNDFILGFWGTLAESEHKDMLRSALAVTIWSVWVLALSTIIGFIGAYFYDQSRKSNTAD